LFTLSVHVDVFRDELPYWWAFTQFAGSESDFLGSKTAISIRKIFF
jgi:hypothetical protein